MKPLPPNFNLADGASVEDVNGTQEEAEESLYVDVNEPREDFGE